LANVLFYTHSTPWHLFILPMSTVPFRLQWLNVLITNQCSQAWQLGDSVSHMTGCWPAWNKCVKPLPGVYNFAAELWVKNMRAGSCNFQRERERAVNFWQKRLWVLNISILPLNSPKVGALLPPIWYLWKEIFQQKEHFPSPKFSWGGNNAPAYPSATTTL